MKIKNIAVIGMGAIGCVYGKLLYDAYGDEFFVIASGARRENLVRDGICLNGTVFTPKVIDTGEKVWKASLIVVCVKNYQLDAAIEDMRNFVDEHTMILPLLNGVTATERLQEAFPQAHVFYGISIAIDAVRTEAGVSNTNNGFIQFGDKDNCVMSQEVMAVNACLIDAKINAQVFPDMMRILWRKWMMNVGCNQVSSITGATYGKFVTVPEVWQTMRAAMLEVVEVAQKLKIDISESDIEEMKKVVQTLGEEGKTSMLQDVENKRKTEVDYFAGTVIEYGKKLGVPVPVNTVLYQLVKGIEGSY